MRTEPDALGGELRHRDGARSLRASSCERLSRRSRNRFPSRASSSRRVHAGSRRARARAGFLRRATLAVMSPATQRSRSRGCARAVPGCESAAGRAALGGAACRASPPGCPATRAGHRRGALRGRHRSHASCVALDRGMHCSLETPAAGDRTAHVREHADRIRMRRAHPRRAAWRACGGFECGDLGPERPRIPEPRPRRVRQRCEAPANRPWSTPHNMAAR